MKRIYVCIVCDYSFDAGESSEGESESPDLFRKLPEDWKCPECGAGKSCFVNVGTIREREEACK